MIWGRVGAQRAQNRSQIDLDRTSDNLRLQPQKLQPHPWADLGEPQIYHSCFLFLLSVPKSQSAHEWNLELVSGADAWCNLQRWSGWGIHFQTMNTNYSLYFLFFASFPAKLGSKTPPFGSGSESRKTPVQSTPGGGLPPPRPPRPSATANKNDQTPIVLSERQRPCAERGGGWWGYSGVVWDDGRRDRTRTCLLFGQRPEENASPR